MRIVLATDAWHPQVNGVVRVNVQMVEALQARGHEVLVISPDGFRTYPLPSYPEIRLAWPWHCRAAKWYVVWGPSSSG